MNNHSEESTGSVKRLKVVPFLKFLLISAIVFVHCDIKYQIPADSVSAGSDIVGFIVIALSEGVPMFYLISGFLFFYGVKKFTVKVYGRKLRNRVRTLLVPYVLWNLFCAGLFLIKVYVFHFPGLGIIENGEINWLKFFEGFIFRKEAGYFPYAFAFWFIRDLIVFVILTPVVWLIARRWWSVILLFAVNFIPEVQLFQIQWFVLGAAFSLHHISFEGSRPFGWLSTTLFGLIYVASEWLGYYCHFQQEIHVMLSYTGVLSAFFFFYSVAMEITRRYDGRVIKFLCSSTFFIYALHQCFSTVNTRFWCHLIGYDSIARALLSFLVSGIAMISICMATYALLRRVSPRLLRVITGDR